MTALTAAKSDDHSAMLWDLRTIQISASERLTETGDLTNLRVCKDTLKVLPILPFPPANTVWVEEVLDEAEAAERCAP